MNNDDDKSLFRDLYGNINKVSHDRNEPWKKSPKAKPRNKVTEITSNPPPLLSHPEIIENPEHGLDNYLYRANGVQNTLMQKLKKGKLPVEALLDLHGMTREMALESLYGFICDSQQQRLKCVQIIHGKGYRSESGKAILKPAVAHWLRQIEAVLAYCPALPKDGGSGALYVLLKTLRVPVP